MFGRPGDGQGSLLAWALYQSGSTQTSTTHSAAIGWASGVGDCVVEDDALAAASPADCPTPSPPPSPPPRGWAERGMVPVVKS